MIPVITIDGPSGAGKGTICHLLAQKLGYKLLDSGALYRLTALAAERQGVSFDDKAGLAEVAASLDVEFEPSDHGTIIWLAGDDVSQAIRAEQVGMNASVVAACDEVRLALLQRQRDFAVAPGLVADGRDMGTTVFPDASVKVFLTASAAERARRRVLQLEAAGADADYDTILSDIESRDKADRERTVSPLKPAEDATLLDCTELGIEQVLAKILLLTK
ncbi:(d)CMP kinase [Candidatus Pelagadaptatus aseana]|uniref:(d)CMP kinase n=1 Tax=Candidatus Pelagadaptatus aseana TaxID=3120508 RepID=UPI003C6F911B